ncbi:MAG: L-seryl-tRNA(Sec) selenium transferase [candidate division Zixibacteria bacterium]|nr:L-seryl-tRNA(Sec) selenium transferase [candidate division Zixibacteria bacterium]
MTAYDSLRLLPSVEELLTSGKFARRIDELSRPLVTAVIRQVLAEIRTRVRQGERLPTTKQIETEITVQLHRISKQRIMPVINGTGILIHTNLGRAPLGKKLFNRVAERVTGYTTLEFDLARGKRGKRGTFLSYLLTLLTDAEAALVVNNNAAAVFLILNTFANRKQVVISRSELVQIGGDFRIPDIIHKAGAKLVEIGTTNKTDMHDYQQAVGKSTALLLKVHRSNFSLEGFVEDVATADVAGIAAKHGVISVFDLGSGTYHQTEKFGMEAEPNITAALRSGVDIVCFSGDKLLGSVQAGIILGKRELIDKMNRNPIYRVLRPDKLTIAMAEETLLAYLKKTDRELLPLWGMISLPITRLRKRGMAIKKALADTHLQIKVVKSAATPGGGSLPGGSMPSVALEIIPPERVSAFTRRLLDADPPLIGYVEDDKLYLDLRTIPETQDDTVVGILRKTN